MMMLMMMVMMMMMIMMMMCKRLAQVPLLCVPIYNMKFAMMQKTRSFTMISAHTKMAADKRGQIEVFGRRITTTIAAMTRSIHVCMLCMHVLYVSDECYVCI